MAESNNKFQRRTCAFLTHLIHWVFFGIITWRMYSHLPKELSNPNIAGTVFVVIGFILLSISTFLPARCKKTWECKWVPNLLFVFSTFVQYGITLHYSHLDTSGKHQEANANCIMVNDGTIVNCTIVGDTRTKCKTLETLEEMDTFLILMTVLPSIVITTLLYLQTDEDSGTDKALFTAFSVLDIIDMAELIFADAGCYISDDRFGIGWLAFFYFSCAVSAILTAFPTYGLEQPKDDDVDLKDFVATIFNAIFSDLFFFILRVATMAKTKHVYFGLIFAIKEVLSFVIRVVKLCLVVRKA